MRRDNRLHGIRTACARTLSTVACLLLTLTSSAGLATAQLAPDAPSTSALAASVLGTPASLRREVPAKVPVKVRRISLANAVSTPPLFWYDRELEYSVALQDGPAPWVFVIAGTGSGWDSGKMRFLQAALWGAGYHVASLSSTTHPNFMVAASSTGTPGLLSQDAADLRRVMAAIYRTWRDDAPAKAFAVVGYSLGATQAAAVANLEIVASGLDFKAAVLINPAVDLYASASRLDAMLASRFPGGEGEVLRFLDRITEAFGETYQQLPGTDVFSDDFLFSAVTQEIQPSRATLEGLVAIAFRVAGMDMAFTADVLRSGGAIVPEGVQLGRFASVTRYLRPSSRTTFEDYVRRILLPVAKKTSPEVTVAALARASSLYPLEARLREDPRMLVVTNEDDFILSADELAWLRRVFGSRARVFADGGHLGALEQRDRMEPVLQHLGTLLP